MHTGTADWTLIGQVKANPRMQIPIIGNGDICTAQDARLAFSPIFKGIPNFKPLRVVMLRANAQEELFDQVEQLPYIQEREQANE